jgi:hypothetical protein
LFERRALLLFRLLLNGPNEIVIELAYDGIEPSPVFSEGFEDDRRAATPYSDLCPGKPDVFWKSNHLRLPVPEKLRRSHRKVRAL